MPGYTSLLLALSIFDFQHHRQTVIASFTRNGSITVLCINLLSEDILSPCKESLSDDVYIHLRYAGPLPFSKGETQKCRGLVDKLWISSSNDSSAP